MVVTAAEGKRAAFQLAGDIERLPGHGGIVVIKHIGAVSANILRRVGQNVCAETVASRETDRRKVRPHTECFHLGVPSPLQSQLCLTANFQ
jgi:hypothetical protein